MGDKHFDFEKRVRLQHKLFNDHFQNYKVYGIPKAQLIIADIPYNVGINAYGSNPSWYVDGDNKNGASSLAGTEFFDTDKDFRITEFLHFCSTMLRKEPKEKGKAPCMIVFCEFEQQFELIEKAKKYGLTRYINLVFRKNFSAQVLKANMRVVGNAEYALILYRDKLPKFNNNGKMVFNVMDWEKDTDSEKIHPTQKPVKLLEKLIKIFTDEGEVVIDPVAGSGSSILAAMNCNRSAYGFEIKKNFFNDANKTIEDKKIMLEEIKTFGWAKTEANKIHPVLDFIN
ncbi:MAG: site-specific DNA-methyltransferase [Candidatus Kapaibacterium sp.]